MITERQKQVLDYIRGYTAERGGVSPTYQEISNACGLKSKGHVKRLVDQLVDRGQIVRFKDRHRAITVLAEPTLPLPPVEIAAKPYVEYTTDNAAFYRWNVFHKTWDRWFPKDYVLPKK